MRRPIASVALSLLLTVALVVPTIAADPSPRADASIEPTPTESAPPSTTPVPTPPQDEPADPAPSAETTASPDPSASAQPAPAIEPAPTAEPTPTAALEPDAESDPKPKPDANAAAEPATDAAGRPSVAGRYIVILSETADTAGVIARHGKGDGVKADRKFDRVRAFAAKLDARQRRALQSDPNVVAVVPDEVIGIAAQVSPTGVSRVGARLSSEADIDTLDDRRVDADVAIVDTGVATHPDLNLVGGVNCTTSNRAAWQDQNGHGTHVAGTVAAIDNTIGVVGVAPGARVWAVRILNSEGFGLLSWYVCGLDWILAQRDPADSTRPLIEAVNMSVAKTGKDDLNCGNTNNDVLHKAICRLYTAGITVVAAAANESSSAAGYVPAAYNEVITVSALADGDGGAGGLDGSFSCGASSDVDDTFANFSNFGSDVDIIAPGKCIYSTTSNGSYGYSSGTSMAAPAVTGAAALYKVTRPLATPAEVRESLRYLGNLGWLTATDPDSIHEPLLGISRLGPLGSFEVNSTTTPARVASNGGTVVVPVTVTRSSTFFERIRLGFTGLPSGWTASLTATSLLGWTVDATTATIKVPATAKPGVYELTVVGTNWGRTRTGTISIEVAGDGPTSSPPIAAIAVGSSTGLLSTGAPTIAARVTWPAATDPSDPIVGYQVQHSVNGGAWRTVSTAATVRTATFSGLATGASHRFQVRAQDADGFWSAWAMTPIPYYVYARSDRSTLMAYRGTWRKVASAPAIGRVITSSAARGAYVTHVFTGRAVAIVAPTSPTRGRAEVWVDGRYRKTIDLRSSTTRHRRVVYAISYATAGSHTIQLRVLGTTGRPTVSFDGLVIFN